MVRKIPLDGGSSALEDKISVIRILDSRRENFKISKAYEYMVDVINVITAPEIEMLIIFNEQKYSKYSTMSTSYKENRSVERFPEK